MPKEKDDKKDVKDDVVDSDKKDDKVDDKVDDKKDDKVDKKDDKVIPEPDDAKDRSELGRKVKAQGEEIAGINSKIDQLIALATPEEIPEEDDEDWIMPTTKQEFEEAMDKRLAARETAITGATKKYNDAYMATIGAFKDHEKYAEICDELEKNFNVRHSDNPKIDARLNFLEAANALQGGKVNLLDKNKGDTKNLGTGGDDEIVDKDEAVMPKLDKDAMAYIEATGKTAEEVIKIMAKPLPLGIGSIG